MSAAAGLDIAVVGGGLSGLAAAWLLARGEGGHRVTLYERQPRPGFTAASVDWQGERVDVPLRVFYPGYYPTLTRLYALLGVPSEPVSYAATFSGADGRPYFRYRNLRWRGWSLGVVAPQDWLRGPRARRIVSGLLSFHGRSLPALKRGELAGLSLRDWAAADDPDFVEGFLLPAVCTVCTCSTEAARRFPAEVIVDYLARGLAKQAVRRALHGADGVEAALRAGIPALRCAAPVARVRAGADGVGLTLADGTEHRHDHAVLATQANQALALLDGAADDERRVLGAFRYQPVEVVTHTDAALMPPDRGDWSPVHLFVDPARPAPESTIWVNAVQPALRGRPDLFQTVHPQRAPRPGTVVGHATFERPMVTADTAAALAGLQALHAQPGRRVWFCGSYAQAGIPLLEGAVGSAAAVARRFGQGLDAENSA
ncbi:MAG: NAD(P)-binding protein [Rubrivivax sp.]